MLIALGLFVVGVITFEATMAAIIANTPDTRQRDWTPADRHKVRRIAVIGFCIWPTLLIAAVVHWQFTGPVVVVVNITAAGVIGFAIFFALRSRHRARLVDEGHCPRCHYDLQGTHHLDHCPECGHELSEPIRTAAAQRAVQQST